MNKITNMSGKIGPHNGIELELMLSGTKPGAVAYDFEMKSWFKYADKFEFVRFNFGGHKKSIGYGIAHKGDRDRAQAIANEFAAPGRDHVAIGRLLGYSEEDIEAFVQQLGNSYVNCKG